MIRDVPRAVSRLASLGYRQAGVSRSAPDDAAVAAEQRAAARALEAALAEHPAALLVADVFDTVLLRTVHPEQVKRLAARRLVARLGLSVDPAELYRLRARLERELCLRAGADGFDEEFRLPELADALWLALPADTRAPSIDREGWQAAMIAAELAVERSVQVLDPHLVPVLDRHVASGGRLVLLSDFYLPSEFLVPLLADAGLGPDRYERLAVSCDTLLTKRSGRLYAQLLAELDVQPGTVLMVGDNAHSDGEMALQAGMRSVVLDRSRQRARYERHAARNSDVRELQGEVNAVLSADPCPDAGPDVFPELALTLAYTVWRLSEQVTQAGHREVCFLAREGRIVQGLFEVAQRLQGGEGQVEARYAYASRRATFLPSLGPLEQERFTSLFRQYRALSVREFLLNLGFQRREADSLADAAGLDPEPVEDDLPTSAAFAALCDSPAFREAYEQRRTEQRDLLRAYFLGSTTDSRLCLVDVGWKGTIQDHVHAALCPAGGTSGFYLGIVAPGAESPENRKTGVLFDFRAAAGRYYDVFDQNRALFEVALSASHGSTAGYVRGADGSVQPVLEPVSEADAAVGAAVEKLQRRLVARAEALLEILAGTPAPDAVVLRHVARRHARMVYFPRPKELAWFRSLSHEENFGLFRRSTFGGGQRPGPSERARSLIRLGLHPRDVLQGAFWPRQGLDELGLAPLGLLYGTWKARRVVLPMRGRP